jgi:hypothetical protein
MSALGWIDFSADHREKVRTVIDLLKKQGVVDELGIGVIRDSFADKMFPGVSTIQTRAKYFTLTALLVQDYERQLAHVRAKQSLEDYLRHWEKDCRIRLAARYGDNGEGLGIIGISFRERKDRDVQRPPSSVYWTGLRRFGFIRTTMSLAEFGRFIGGRRSFKALLEGTDREKGDDPDAEADGAPRVHAPDVDDNYWDNLAITLTPEEAEFLRGHITARVPDSLLGQILMDGDAIKQIVSLRSDASFVDFADLPCVKSLKSEELRKVVQHARDFWLIFKGAHIRYNCLLQDRFGTEHVLAEFERTWSDWLEEVRHYDWATWDKDFMWSLVEQHGSIVREATRRFVDGWTEQARGGAPRLEDSNRLVVNQELANKGSRARLRSSAKDQHVGNEWIGLKELDYRLPQVRTLVEDIQRAESGEADADAGR